MTGDLAVIYAYYEYMSSCMTVIICMIDMQLTALLLCCGFAAGKGIQSVKIHLQQIKIKEIKRHWS